MPDINEQIDRAAETGRKAADEASRVGSDIARRATETTRDTLESGLNSTVQGLKHVTDQFTQVLGFAGPQAEEMVRRSAQNMEAVSQAGTVLAKGTQEISREWFGLMQERLAKNLDAMNRLAGCRTFQDFVTVQSDIMRDRLGQTVEGSRRIAEVSMRVADEAARVIQSQTSRNAAAAEKNVPLRVAS